MIKKMYGGLFVLAFMLFAGYAQAQTSSTLYKTTDDGLGEEIGTVTFTDTEDGLNISYNLDGLVPGEHGFHVHEHPNCSSMIDNGNIVHASAAGGHYDPDQTGKHLGPDGDGHKGDLPKIVVDGYGKAVGSYTFGKGKNLKAEDFKDRSIMIHEGGDNYSDEPTLLGGGGARVACGIIK